VTAPFFFVTTHTVKDGRLDDLKALNAEFVDFVERHEPDIIAYMHTSAKTAAG
jgi:hypothetical protein